MKYVFMRYPGGKAKAVTFSYDDGTIFDKKFLNIINNYNLKCTFNLIGESVKQEKCLTVDFIRDNIIKKGHEIANHGYNHKALNSVRVADGLQDTLDSRRYLEKEFGMIIRGMAFPDRSVNRFKEPDVYSRVKSYLNELDIAYCRCAGGDNDTFELPEDWHNWMPTAHHDNPLLMEYIDKFINLDINDLYCAMRSPKLFFLWGHSYEFENNNNWDLLENICKKLSGRDDIWYVTSMELYDYVKAYNSLIYSIDGSIIYNPTLVDIWFDIDGVTYCIKTGEYLKISK